ncbi:MAG: NAD(P)-dependent oxidoreductase, partial [Deltaproteobacteria bacterium]|nr:NAD(P)-dependent oxidoreductase [Deltaproteobacteria bacterium]
MKIKYLPVGLNVNGKRVIVVGGGRVASMKIKKLLSAGARITVLSPVLCADLKGLSERGAIEHKIARFHSDIMGEADLLIAA